MFKETIAGCISKDGEEIDGGEFEVDNLVDLIEILQQNKEVHLKYFIGEPEIDL